MAAFTRLFITFVLLIQTGITEAGQFEHIGHGHLHERNLFNKRAAQVNPTIPTNWTYVQPSAFHILKLTSIADTSHA